MEVECDEIPHDPRLDEKHSSQAVHAAQRTTIITVNETTTQVLSQLGPSN